MQAEEKRFYTPDEYLEQEVSSELRHECINGVIVPMMGGTPEPEVLKDRLSDEKKGQNAVFCPLVNKK
ncbi:hypothetical protein O77CONTIG1_00372 [Leptolyngbya sp. O-77]|nr:hypothetical protein O77CONTIG1_00372 [Leptolyngbya sp. O-77]